MTTSTGVLSADREMPVGDPIGPRTRRRLSNPIASIVALVIAFLWTLPTIGVFVASFRPERQVKTEGWWTVFSNPDFTLENYEEVLFGRASGELMGNVVNTIVITVPAVLLPLAIAAFAAYALAWIDFRGRDWIYIMIFALQVVPLQMALVPLLQFFSAGFQIGGVQLLPAWDFEYSGFFSLWFAHTAFALPLGVFLLHNFMAELPREVFEAARVDGAGHAQIFTKMVLPLIVPALAAFAIFQFLWVWNDLLVGLTFAGPNAAPLMVVLSNLVGTRGSEWHLLTAGAFIAIIIPLIVFFSLQRYFIRGLLAGSVKG